MPESPDLLAPLQALIKRWRYENQRINQFHATMGIAYGVCADALESALAPLASQITALQQENDTLRSRLTTLQQALRDPTWDDPETPEPDGVRTRSQRAGDSSPTPEPRT